MTGPARSIGALLSAALIAALFTAGCGSTGGSMDGGSADDSPPAPPPPPAEARCVTLWNSALNRGNRGMMGNSSFGKPYVSVGFSADYPDKCLLTVSLPDIGRAFQYQEAGTNSEAFRMSWSGSSTGLDPTTVGWNASVTADGLLELTQ
jgi:hypothetical protein